MWDFQAQEPTSSRPRFPAPPNPWAPPPTRKTAPAYPAPFGFPPVPPPRRSAPNKYGYYHTFPRSAVVPQGLAPGPPHSRWIPPPRAPTPQVIPINTLSQQHANRHDRLTRKGSHSRAVSAAPSRHVHYADQMSQWQPRSRSAQNSHAPQLAQIYPTASTSRQLPATAVQPSTQGYRRRALSAGSATGPVTVNFTQSQPQQRARADSGRRHKYSRCTGRKKALCIGINYIGQKRALNGCINDVKNVKRFLTRQWGFREGDIVVLIDDSTNPRQMPTRRNMIDAMKWLVKDAQPHDSLFFHYSGHGGQIPDTHGDKTDGYDEVIYPVDYKTAGIIIDDELNQLMVKPLPRGCRLTAIFDSCHSGTTLDLPFMYHHDGTLKDNHIAERSRALRMSSADVISFSACRDDQTSADTVLGGMAVGAMSYAFLTALTRKPVQSYLELLHSIRGIVQPRFQQKAQLSSGHYIDTRIRFIL